MGMEATITVLSLFNSIIYGVCNHSQVLELKRILPNVNRFYNADGDGINDKSTAENSRNRKMSIQATAEIGEARMNYSYEYQGCKPELVVTPATDKCFLAMTQAAHLGYGTSFYGPAGEKFLEHI